MVAARVYELFEEEASQRQLATLKKGDGPVGETIPERELGRASDKAAAAIGGSAASWSDRRIGSAAGIGGYEAPRRNPDRRGAWRGYICGSKGSPLCSPAFISPSRMEEQPEENFD